MIKIDIINENLEGRKEEKDKKKEEEYISLLYKSSQHH